MAKYSAVKATVNAYIKQNGRKEITGKVLNAVLNATIDSLGKYFQFAGGASPTDDPGTPDQNVCYLAGEPGVYTNFGSITIENEEVALLFWDGEWTKQRILIGIREVNASVDNQVGTPSVDVSYSGGELVLTFHNLKGGQGETGDPAGFGTIGADINGGVGTPGVSVETSGDNTAKNLMFHFTNLKGETGVTSVVATIDDTSGTPSCQVSLVGQQLTLAFSGLKGLKGDTGVSADYPITIYNGLDSDATDQALAAAQGKVLDGKVSQLGRKVDDLDGELGVLHNSLSIPDNTQTVLFNNLDIKAGDTFYLKVVSSVAWTRLYITPTGANDKILDNQYVSSQFEGGFVAKINITTIKCLMRVSSASSVSCTLKINASRDIERNGISVGLLRDSLRQNIEQSQNLFDQFNKVDFGSLLTDTRSAPYSCIRHCSITGAGITLRFEQGTYTASNIIPVESQQTYICSVNIRVLVYYDAMMAVVGSYFTTTPALEQITIPNGVAFIRLILADTAFDGEKIVFCKGTTIVPWEKPYRIGENVDSLVELRRRSANLIATQTILENVAISVSGSSVYTTSSNDKYNSVLDLPLDSGVTYLVGPVRVYQLLNSDKSAVLGYSGTMQYGYFEITPNQDALLSFSVLKANIPFVCVKGKADSYEPFGEMVNTDLFNKMVEYASPLHGKKLYNFGDSVSAGDGNQLRGAADILGEELGFQVWDYAVGGATMTDQTAEHPTISCVQKQIENAPSQSPDIVLIAGGINDLSYAQIGDAPVVSSALDFNASYINNVDKTKISGALESAISKAINKWPTASIVYMYEHKMYAHAGGTMVQLHDVAIAVCKKWSVPVLDMMDYGGINLAIPIYKQLYGANNGEDGTHITESGYRKFYLPRLRAILESVCQMNGE